MSEKSKKSAGKQTVSGTSALYSFETMSMLDRIGILRFKEEAVDLNGSGEVWKNANSEVNKSVYRYSVEVNPDFPLFQYGIDFRKCNRKVFYLTGSVTKIAEKEMKIAYTNITDTLKLEGFAYRDVFVDGYANTELLGTKDKSTIRHLFRILVRSGMLEPLESGRFVNELRKFLYKAEMTDSTYNNTLKVLKVMEKLNEEAFLIAGLKFNDIFLKFSNHMLPDKDVIHNVVRDTILDKRCNFLIDGVYGSQILENTLIEIAAALNFNRDVVVEERSNDLLRNFYDKWDLNVKFLSHRDLEYISRWTKRKRYYNIKVVKQLIASDPRLLIFFTSDNAVVQGFISEKDLNDLREVDFGDDKYNRFFTAVYKALDNIITYYRLIFLDQEVGLFSNTEMLKNLNESSAYLYYVQNGLFLTDYKILNGFVKNKFKPQLDKQIKGYLKQQKELGREFSPIIDLYLCNRYGDFLKEKERTIKDGIS